MMLTADFYGDWINQLESVLTRWGHDTTGYDPKDVAITFFNLKLRLVSARPRTIEVSEEFDCPSGFDEGLEKLKNKIEAGDDLIPHLSRWLTRDAEFNDMMLNDWGIHHFHLGTEIKDDGFVARSGPLLYAMIRGDTAYFLDVRKHRNWSNLELLEIAERNWPELLAPYEHGIEGTTVEIDSGAVSGARRAGGMVLVELNGGYYCSPGGGYATSGTSIAVVQKHDFTARMLSDFEDRLLSEVSNLPFAVPNTGHIELRFDENSQSYVQLPNDVQLRTPQLRLSVSLPEPPSS